MERAQMERAQVIQTLQAQAQRLHEAVEVVPWTEKHKVFDLRDQANVLAHTLQLEMTKEEKLDEAIEFISYLDEILGFIDRKEF